MFEGIANFFKKLMKSEAKQTPSKETAKERLHLVLMQDRANVSADFLELMKQEIIEVIKKYIEVEESAIDVRLTKEVKEDGSQGAPSLYANIPILNIKNDMKNEIKKEQEEPVKEEKNIEDATHSDPEKEIVENNTETKEAETSEKIKEDKQENGEEEIKEDLQEKTVEVGDPVDPKEKSKESKNNENEEKEDKQDIVEDKKENESIKEDKTEENKDEKDNSKKENNN